MRRLLMSVFALGLVGSLVLAGEYNRKVSVGDQAPDFSGIQAVEGSKDTSLSLGDIKEKVAVVVFLANHCPVVVNNEDRLIDLAEEFQGKSVKLVGICCTDPDSGQGAADNLAAIKKRVADKGYNFAYGYDPSGEVGKAYGATVTPQVFVLCEGRKIRYMGAIDDSPNNPGSAKKAYVKDAVNALLAGKDVEVKETRAQGCGIKYATR